MRLSGRVFRAHNPRWSFAPLSGAGAALYGGRFNAVGTPALYTSRRMETAWLEAQQGFAFKPQPLTICAYDIDCTDLVDLTDPQERAQRSLRDDDLACPWEDMASRSLEPPSWALARRLAGEGAAGVIAPSFAPGATEIDRNVVFWRWGADLPYRVVVVDDEARLPANDRSWR